MVDVARRKAGSFLEVVVSCFAAWVLAKYQDALPFICVALPAAVLLIFSLRYKRKCKLSLRRIEIVTIGVFALLCSAAFVVSFNIVITGSTYNGLASENYLNPWGAFDWIALVVIALTLYVLLSAVYLKMNECRNSGGKPLLTFDASRKINVRFLLLLAILLLVTYLPYLLLYWPGLIFGDTLSSFAQALSGNYVNHHPVAYTFGFTVGIKIMTHLGFSVTSGIALYVFFQMLVMALTLGYFSAWICARFNLSKWVGVALACFFGAIPYFALYSIAMWKDPLFSMSLVLMTIFIADVVLGGRKRIA